MVVRMPQDETWSRQSGTQRTIEFRDCEQGFPESRDPILFRRIGVEVVQQHLRLLSFVLWW